MALDDFRIRPQLAFEHIATGGEDTHHRPHIFAEAYFVAELEAVELAKNTAAYDHLVGTGSEPAPIHQLHIASHIHAALVQTTQGNIGFAASAFLDAIHYHVEFGGYQWTLGVSRYAGCFFNKIDLVAADRTVQLRLGALAHHQRHRVRAGAAHGGLEALGHGQEGEQYGHHHGAGQYHGQGHPQAPGKAADIHHRNRTRLFKQRVQN